MYCELEVFFFTFAVSIGFISLFVCLCVLCVSACGPCYLIVNYVMYALYVCMVEGLAYTLFQPGLTIDNTTCTVCARHVLGLESSARC